MPEHVCHFDEDYYGFLHCAECGAVLPPWAFDDPQNADEDEMEFPNCEICGGEFWPGGTTCTCGRTPVPAAGEAQNAQD
jgi:uncharacterized protein with PIN domain